MITSYQNRDVGFSAEPKDRLQEAPLHGQTLRIEAIAAKSLDGGFYKLDPAYT